jgi:hypothetical protein
MDEIMRNIQLKKCIIKRNCELEKSVFTLWNNIYQKYDKVYLFLEVIKHKRINEYLMKWKRVVYMKKLLEYNSYRCKMERRRNNITALLNFSKRLCNLSNLSITFLKKRSIYSKERILLSWNDILILQNKSLIIERKNNFLVV